MPIIRVKGHDLSYTPVRDSALRRAVQISNKMGAALGRLGLKVDDLDVHEERAPQRKAPATVTWWIDGTHCFYSFSRAGTYVDNLQVILALIEKEVSMVLAGERSREDFVGGFAEDPEVEVQRREAREALGIGHENVDLKQIDEAFKKRSRELHPDMPTGDTEKFQALNKAHKILRRELE